MADILGNNALTEEIKAESEQEESLRAIQHASPHIHQFVADVRDTLSRSQVSLENPQEALEKIQSLQLQVRRHRQTASALRTMLKTATQASAFEVVQ